MPLLTMLKANPKAIEPKIGLVGEKKDEGYPMAIEHMIGLLGEKR